MTELLRELIQAHRRRFLTLAVERSIISQAQANCLWELWLELDSEKARADD